MTEEAILSNGLRVIHTRNTFSKVGHLGAFVNVGSRDEDASNLGVAHFLEHVIFKGTKSRKAFHILNRLDSVGGEINAYTTKEETCVYASFPLEFLKRSVELLNNVLFESTFPDYELEKEKEVVLDEINSYRDSPSDLIFDEFDHHLFRNHPLGKDILGNEEDVNKIEKSTVLKFVQTYYQPQNMVISSVGNYSLQRLLKIIEEYFGVHPSGTVTLKRTQPEKYTLFNEVIEKDIAQAHTILGAPGVSAKDKMKAPLLLLNNVLGGPAMNSRLNLNIREKHGITYMLESNCTIFSDCGVFSIYHGTDPKNSKRTDQLVKKELLKLCNNEMGVQQLSSSKKQIKGQLAIGMESALGVMLNQGKSLLLYDKVDTTDEILKIFEKITAQQVLEVANKIVHPDNLSVLKYIPK